MALPAGERFQGEELRKSDSIVVIGGSSVAVFGPLPELARVASWKEGFVFLALVHEDRLAFESDLAGAQRNGDFDFVEWVLLPSASVEEYIGDLLASSLPLEEDAEDRFGADSMGAVRIGQVPCDVDLIWHESPEQLIEDRDVVGPDRILRDGSRAIEGEIEEVQVGLLAADRQCSGAGFVLANQSLDAEDGIAVRLAWSFVDNRLSDFLRERSRSLRFNSEDVVVFSCQVGYESRIVIEDRDIPAGHVSDMNVVLVIDQADEGPSHTDDIVVGVGTKA